jgi:hypothetical protein
MAGIAPILSQQWSGSWYPSTIQALLGIAGPGFEDANTGITMPNLSAIDTMAILGLVTGSVVSAIERFNRDTNGISDKRQSAILSSDVDGDGVLVDLEVILGQAMGDATHHIDAKTYLSYPTDLSEAGMASSTPWRRYPPSETQDGLWAGLPRMDTSFEVYVVNAVYKTDARVVTIGMVRQMIADYQRMVMACSSAIYACSADVTNPAPQDDLTEFLGALRSLCADFDVLNENPTEFASIAEALHAALAKTSEFVGKALADISAEVGKQAGIVGAGVTGGFLENAGLLSIVVVGIVIYLFLR